MPRQLHTAFVLEAGRQPWPHRSPRKAGLRIAAFAGAALFACQQFRNLAFSAPGPAAGSLPRAALRPTVAAGLGLLLGAGPSAAEEDVVNEPVPKVGQQAPDFDLISSDGEDVALQSILKKKRKAVLVFNRGLGEAILLKNFERELPKFRELNAEVVGISTVKAERLAGFKSQQGISFTLVEDKKGKVGQKYGVARGQGPLLGINNKCSTFVVGLDGKIEAYWSYPEVQLTTGKHSRDVLEKMRAT